MSQIVIVDDNSGITKILTEIFVGLGQGVLTAKNVPEAKETLEELTGIDLDVDLVVTDIEMPGESGLDLIDHIQANYPKTKVIAISNGGENAVNLEKYIKDAKSKGAVRFLPKPFKVLDLVTLVKEVLEGH